MRPAWDVEHSLLVLCYPQLKELSTRRFSIEELQPLTSQIMGDLRLFGASDTLGESGRAYQTKLALLAVKAYPAAKQYLVEHGRAKEDVEAMPVAQAVMLYSMATFAQLRDEQFRWLCLPYAEAAELARRDEQRSSKEAANREIIPLAQIYLPSLRMVFSAGARTDRRIAALRLIEALRLYAADHEGRLPAVLSEITTVPVPIDPVTGKVFEYAQTGDTATISSPPTDKSKQSGLRYEIKMMAK
jgi:hypothetical protein